MIFYPSNKHVINVVPWAKIEIEIFVEHHTTLLEHDGKEAKSCSEAESQSPHLHSVYIYTWETGQRIWLEKVCCLS